MDYHALYAHFEKAREYGEVKRRTAADCGGDRQLYTKSKTDFIQSVLALAEEQLRGDL